MQVFMSPSGASSWIAPVITGSFAILGVLLGTLLNQRASFSQAQKIKMRELRIQSYAKLMGLKSPLEQAVITCAEAKLLCEFYDARFYLTQIQADLDESRRQNDRAISMFPEVAALRRELAETLGQIQISFPMSAELDAAIQAIYKAPVVDVPEVRGKLPTEGELDKWMDANVQMIHKMVPSKYSNVIQGLLDLLLPLTDRH